MVFSKLLPLVKAVYPSELELRVGAKPRATGVYMTVHEDGERRWQHRRKLIYEGYNDKQLHRH